MAQQRKTTTNAVRNRAQSVVARIRGKHLLEQRELEKLDRDDPGLAAVVRKMLEEERESS